MTSENIEKIRQRITFACERARRDPSEVTLLAVSKTFSGEKVREALQGGVVDIGENYVQELLRKKEQLSHEQIRWHFIGHLQSNKVKYIAKWIHLIHTADSVELVDEIDKRAAHSDRVIEVLVEVNTTAESSKYGIQPRNTVEFIKKLAGYRHICIAGLMTIGPFLPDPEGSRPMFRQLRLLKDEVAHCRQSNVQMKHLSMGMTGDFEVAIQEGATIVRIGTAVFGPRTKHV